MKARKDIVRSYLADISRIPLLTPEQEIALGRKVQRLKSNAANLTPAIANLKEAWNDKTASYY